jgi:hypothetical protein
VTYKANENAPLRKKEKGNGYLLDAARVLLNLPDAARFFTSY